MLGPALLVVLWATVGWCQNLPPLKCISDGCTCDTFGNGKCNKLCVTEGCLLTDKNDCSLCSAKNAAFTGRKFDSYEEVKDGDYTQYKSAKSTCAVGLEQNDGQGKTPVTIQCVNGEWDYSGLQPCYAPCSPLHCIKIPGIVSCSTTFVASSGFKCSQEDTCSYGTGGSDNTYQCPSGWKSTGAVITCKKSPAGSDWVADKQPCVDSCKGLKSTNEVIISRDPWRCGSIPAKYEESGNEYTPDIEFNTVCPFDCATQTNTMRQTRILTCPWTSTAGLCETLCSAWGSTNTGLNPSNTKDRSAKGETFSATCSDGWSLAGYPCRNPFTCDPATNSGALTTPDAKTKCFQGCRIDTLGIAWNAGCYFREAGVGAGHAKEGKSDRPSEIPHGRRCELSCEIGYIRRGSVGPYCYNSKWVWVNRKGDPVKQASCSQSAQYKQPDAPVQLQNVVFGRLDNCTVLPFHLQYGELKATTCQIVWQSGFVYDYECKTIPNAKGVDVVYEKAYESLRCYDGEWYWYNSGNRGPVMKSIDGKMPSEHLQGFFNDGTYRNAVVNDEQKRFSAQGCVAAKATVPLTGPGCSALPIVNGPGCPATDVGGTCKVACNTGFLPVYSRYTHAPGSSSAQAVSDWWKFRWSCLPGGWDQKVEYKCVDQCSLRQYENSTTVFSDPDPFAFPTGAGCKLKNNCDGFCNLAASENSGEYRLDCTTSLCGPEDGPCDTKPEGKVEFRVNQVSLSLTIDKKPTDNAWIGVWDSADCDSSTRICKAGKWAAARHLVSGVDIKCTGNSNCELIGDLTTIDLSDATVFGTQLSRDMVVQVFHDLGNGETALLYSGGFCDFINCQGDTLDDDLTDVDFEGTPFEHSSQIVLKAGRTFITQDENVGKAGASPSCLATGCRCEEYGVGGECHPYCANAECNYDGYDCHCASPWKLAVEKNWANITCTDNVNPARASGPLRPDGKTGRMDLEFDVLSVCTATCKDGSFAYQIQNKPQISVFTCGIKPRNVIAAEYVAAGGKYRTGGQWVAVQPNEITRDAVQWIDGVNDARACVKNCKKTLDQIWLPGKLTATSPASLNIDTASSGLNTKCTTDDHVHVEGTECIDYICKSGYTKAPGAYIRCRIGSDRTQAVWVASQLELCVKGAPPARPTQTCLELNDNNNMKDSYLTSLGRNLKFDSSKGACEGGKDQTCSSIICKQTDYEAVGDLKAVCSTELNVQGAVNIPNTKWWVYGYCVELCPEKLNNLGTTVSARTDPCSRDSRKPGSTTYCEAECKDKDKGAIKKCDLNYQCACANSQCTSGRWAPLSGTRTGCWKGCKCTSWNGFTCEDNSKWYEHGTALRLNSDLKCDTDKNDIINENEMYPTCYDGTWRVWGKSGFTGPAASCKNKGTTPVVGQPPSAPTTTKTCDIEKLQEYITRQIKTPQYPSNLVRADINGCSQTWNEGDSVQLYCDQYFGVKNTNGEWVPGTSPKVLCTSNGWVWSGGSKPVCAPNWCPPLPVNTDILKNRFANAKDSGDKTIQPGSDDYMLCDATADGAACDFQCADGYVPVYQKTATTRWWQKMTCNKGTWQNYPVCVQPCRGLETAKDPQQANYTSYQYTTAGLDTPETCPPDADVLCDGFCTRAVDPLNSRCTGLSCASEGLENCAPPQIVIGRITPTEVEVKYTVYNRWLTSTAWLEIREYKPGVANPTLLAAKFLYTDTTTCKPPLKPNTDGFCSRPGSSYPAYPMPQSAATSGQTKPGFLPELTAVSEKFSTNSLDTSNPDFNAALKRGAKLEAVVHWDLLGADDLDGGQDEANIIGKDTLCSSTGDTTPQPNAGKCFSKTYKPTKRGSSTNVNIDECARTGCHCEHLGDGFCDPECNNPTCGADDGDCGCKETPAKAGAIRGQTTDAGKSTAAIGESVSYSCAPSWVAVNLDGTLDSAQKIQCQARTWDINGGQWEPKICEAPCYSEPPKFDEFVQFSCYNNDSLTTANPALPSRSECTASCTMETDLITREPDTVRDADTVSAVCRDGSYRWALTKFEAEQIKSGASQGSVSIYDKTVDVSSGNIGTIDQGYCMYRCEFDGAMKATSDDWAGSGKGEGDGEFSQYWDCSTPVEQATRDGWTKKKKPIDAAKIFTVCTPKCNNGAIPSGAIRCVVKKASLYNLHEVEWQKIAQPTCVKPSDQKGCIFDEFSYKSKDVNKNDAWVTTGYGYIKQDGAGTNCVPGSWSPDKSDGHQYVPPGAECEWTCNKYYTPYDVFSTATCTADPTKLCIKCNGTVGPRDTTGVWTGQPTCLPPCRTEPIFVGYDANTAALCISDSGASGEGHVWRAINESCPVKCDEWYVKSQCDAAEVICEATGPYPSNGRRWVKPKRFERFADGRVKDWSRAEDPRCFAPCDILHMTVTDPQNIINGAFKDRFQFSSCASGATKVKHGETCTPKCSDSTRFADSLTPLLCNDGTFIGELGQCLKVTASNQQCDLALLEDIFHANPLVVLSQQLTRFHCARLVNPGNYTVTCEPGYEPLHDQMEVHCQDGRWFYTDASRPPECAKVQTCKTFTNSLAFSVRAENYGKYEVIANAKAEMFCANTPPGSDCAVECADGYTVYWGAWGQKNNNEYGPICDKDGSWINIPHCRPTCEASGCDEQERTNMLCDNICTNPDHPCSTPACDLDGGQCADAQPELLEMNVQCAQLQVNFLTNKKLIPAAWIGAFSTDTEDDYNNFRWANTEWATIRNATFAVRPNPLRGKEGQPRTVYAYSQRINLNLDPDAPNRAVFGDEARADMGNIQIQLYPDASNKAFLEPIDGDNELCRGNITSSSKSCADSLKAAEKKANTWTIVAVIMIILCCLLALACIVLLLTLRAANSGASKTGAYNEL